MEVGREVRTLLLKLFKEFYRYFDTSTETLNSDGRRLFEELARYLVYEHPELKPLVKKVRREPTLQNLLKLVDHVLGEREYAEELLSTAIYGPYTLTLGQGSGERDTIDSSKSWDPLRDSS